MTPSRIAVVAAMFMAGVVAAVGGIVRPEEMRQKEPVGQNKPARPASEIAVLVCLPRAAIGKAAGGMAKKAEAKKLNASRTQHLLVRTDPRTGLEVCCVAVQYADFPAIEWTVYFKNTGKETAGPRGHSGHRHRASADGQR